MSHRSNSRSPIGATRVLVTGVVAALLVTFFVFSLSANARNTRSDDGAAVAPLFASNSLMTVTIEAPLTTLMRDRPDEEYLVGKFSFHGDDGTEQTVDLKVRTRGEYRRQKKH